MADRMRHRAGAALAFTVVALLTTGCTPDPAPSPSPTGFASEEEAFAAAEETYRAYVDAVNARNNGLAAGEQPTSFLTGEALQAEIDSEKQFQELGIRLGGPMRVSEFEVTASTAAKASGSVCLDVSQARVLDEEGNDVTPADRSDRLGLIVEFVWSPKATLIAQSIPSDAACS